MNFPQDFLWGAAISGYQCEGGNFNCDWYEWEKSRNLERCGMACDHYHLYQTDLKMAAALNLNSLRFSIEWPRIFPDQNLIEFREVEHYRRVLQEMKSFGLKPHVTLHHFTNPLWFMEKGGWLESKNIDHFLKYVKTIVDILRNDVSVWTIFNEPMVYLYNGYVDGVWPPGLKSIPEARKAMANISSAYISAYQEIKRIYKNSGKEAYVSLTQNLRVFSPCPQMNLGQNSLSAYVRSKIFNFYLLDHFAAKHCMDFIGLNYYSREYDVFSDITGKECGHVHKERKNDCGWYVYPKGIYQCLKSLKHYKLPIVISENGTAEAKNEFYEDFLNSHLKEVWQAIQDGVDVRGYYWWSLLDNFEWDKGYSKKFGLFELDRKTFERRPRPFAQTYARIAKENKL